MQIRIITQKTKKGKTRKYAQLVESVRRPDGLPTKKVIAHLGVYDPLLHENMKVALKASREKLQLSDLMNKTITVEVTNNLLYLPFALISQVYRQFGLQQILDSLIPPPPRSASAAVTLEALVAHRCLAPGSKLAFQGWIETTAVEDIIAVAPRALNNTRIHRVMEELADNDTQLQTQIRQKIVSHKTPLILYFDLTDTWFVTGGGSMARRGTTKEGHRSKRKIHIALLVNEQGLPLRWKVLPGALNETTVLPEWLPFLNKEMGAPHSVLVFDRGMPSADNFRKLVDPTSGHLFLTSVKSDSIPTYVTLDDALFFQLQEVFDQNLSPHEKTREMERLLEKIGFRHFHDKTYTLDLGIVTPPVPRTTRHTRPPRMRMYLYFNREIQQTKSRHRHEKLDLVKNYVAALNEELTQVKQSRKETPTRRKVERLIEKHSLTELYKVKLTPHSVQGKTKKLQSFQIELLLDEKMYRYARRYDGISLLVGHPDLPFSVEESIRAYRQKDVVETDFRTIKSVLKIRPTFHWTDCKIKSHVTICVISLLIERLIEQRLKSDPAIKGMLPRTASALFEQLDAIKLTRLRVGKNVHTMRTKEHKQIKEVLTCLGATELLDKFESQKKIP